MAFEYQCVKCGHKGFCLSELRGPSGGITAYLNIDSQVVTLLTCLQCRYSEVYLTGIEEFKTAKGLDGDYFPEGGLERDRRGPKWQCACGYLNDPTLEICASCNEPREPSKVISIDD